MDSIQRDYGCFSDWNYWFSNSILGPQNYEFKEKDSTVLRESSFGYKSLLQRWPQYSRTEQMTDPMRLDRWLRSRITKLNTGRISWKGRRSTLASIAWFWQV